MVFILINGGADCNSLKDYTKIKVKNSKIVQAGSSLKKIL